MEWLTRGVRLLLPEEWQRFRDQVPMDQRESNLAAAYPRLLTCRDDVTADAAARAWCDWENALVAHETGGRGDPRYEDPRFRLGFARLVTHYFSHAAWLEDDQLLSGAARLAGVPGVLVHGRLDLASPLDAAWQLHQSWPGSELVVLDAGHRSDVLREHVTAATTRFLR